MMNLTKKQYTQSDKILMSVCVIAAGVLVYSLANFKATKVKFAKNDASQINYEMAKLQNAESLYSLENREIEMDYKALEAKKAAAKAEAKKVTDKTKKAITPAAAQAAVQQAMAQKVAAQRKAQTAQRLQAQYAAQPKYNETSAQAETNLNQTPYAAQDSYKAVDNTVPTDVPATDKKSYQQWKSEIFSAQSKEAIVKLVAALKKGDISNDDFQKLAAEMIASKDDKMVGLGLYALRSAPSTSSYIQLVKAQGNVNSSLETYVQQSLMAYNQTANLGFLKQSLVSKDKQVVMKTLEIIKSGVTSIKAGEVTGLVDPRNVRDTAAAQFSLTNYLPFLPFLQQLAASSDQEIVALANQNISLIDDPQYIAAN